MNVLSLALSLILHCPRSTFYPSGARTDVSRWSLTVASFNSSWPHRPSHHNIVLVHLSECCKNIKLIALHYGIQYFTQCALVARSGKCCIIRTLAHTEDWHRMYCVHTACCFLSEIVSVLF